MPKATSSSSSEGSPAVPTLFPSPSRRLRISDLDQDIIRMCKHILNAQVSIRAPCCKQWFDCAECHAESQDHRLRKTAEMAFMCKKCKKAFRKDMSEYDDSDEYCPHCDNHYVLEAKIPQAALGLEGDDPRINARMLRDDRAKQDSSKSIFARDVTDRLG